MSIYIIWLVIGAVYTLVGVMNLTGYILWALAPWLAFVILVAVSVGVTVLQAAIEKREG